MLATSLAAVDQARIFHLLGQHVIAIAGQQPGGSQVELQELVAGHGDSLAILVHPGGAPGAASESYYLVKPVLAPGPLRPAVRLEHAGGCDLIRVEPLNCGATRVIGHSPSFRFDDAFEGALRQLPPFRESDPRHALSLVDIVAMGAIYGGFSGFSRMFVQLQVTAARLPNP